MLLTNYYSAFALTQHKIKKTPVHGTKYYVITDTISDARAITHITGKVIRRLGNNRFKTIVPERFINTRPDPADKQTLQAITDVAATLTKNNTLRYNLKDPELLMLTLTTLFPHIQFPKPVKVAHRYRLTLGKKHTEMIDKLLTSE